MASAPMLIEALNDIYQLGLAITNFIPTALEYCNGALDKTKNRNAEGQKLVLGEYVHYLKDKFVG